MKTKLLERRRSSNWARRRNSKTKFGPEDGIRPRRRNSVSQTTEDAIRPEDEIRPRRRNSAPKTKFGPGDEIRPRRRNSAPKTKFGPEDEIRPRRRNSAPKTKFGPEDEIRPRRRHSAPKTPNSGVRGNLGVRDRPTRIQASGIRAPNSGVRGNFRRQGPADAKARSPASGTLATNLLSCLFSHGRQACGGRNSGVKFGCQKHFRRHLSGNRIQASASNSSVGRNLGVSRRPDRNLGVEFERQPNVGVNSSAPNLGAKFELQMRASGGDEMGTQIPVSLYWMRA